MSSHVTYFHRVRAGFPNDGFSDPVFYTVVAVLLIFSASYV